MYAKHVHGIWFFTAGSWSRSKFDQQVRKAAEGLRRGGTALEDYCRAVKSLREAVMVLKRWGDLRDAGDLVEVVEGLEVGGW